MESETVDNKTMLWANCRTINHSRMTNNANARASNARLARAVKQVVLFQPEFQAKCVDAVQIVSKQPFISHEAEFLVEMKRSCVRYFRLKYNLNTHTITWKQINWHC